MDKNKKQRFSPDFNSKPKVQKVYSEIIPPSFNTQYSLKFKNRINSYNPSMNRKRNASMNQYNPYWMISNSIVNNITKSNNKSRKNSTLNVTSELENKKSTKDIINSKNISESPKSVQTLIYSSFENQLNDDFATNNNKKSLFSLFYNNKENINNANIKTVTAGNDKNGFLKRNESVLNLANIYHNNMQKSINSYSSSSSSIYSSQYNNNYINNENHGNNYNKVIVINSSSNNQHIKSKEINRIVNSKESNFDSTPRSLDVSSLMDTSMTQLSSVTEVSSITISSETMNSYINNGVKDKNEQRNLTQRKYDEHNNNIKLKFRNLYLSKRISHKISSKNIDYFNNKKQSRKSSESYFTSSDEFPATLYTFRQINTRFPKQFRKTSMENYKIHMFKDNNGINKNSKNTMKKIHHKKNASKRDYMYTIECLNAITTDQNTIKSVKKSGELIEGFKNKCVNNSNHYVVNNDDNEHDNSFIVDAYNYPKDIYENDINQFISNNEVNHQYERDFIHGNLKQNYPLDNRNNYESPNQVLDNIESNDLEKQKQDLQQLLIQQIQQQSRYYQENKIDYSYSCTTLSSYTSDESFYDSDDDYSVPDITKHYYETLAIPSNPTSPVKSFSFKNHRNDSLSIQASLSSIANDDLKKITSLCNNINTTLEQIKVINEEIETNSNSSNINGNDDKESIDKMKLRNKTIQLQHGEQIQPIFHNNTLMVDSSDIHNTNFNLYDSDVTESITSSSTISTDSIKDTNYLYYKETFDKPFYNLVNYS